MSYNTASLRRFGVKRPQSFTLNKLSGVQANQTFHPLPAPTGPAPYHLSLDQILPPEVYSQIGASLILHTVGDTGGVVSGTNQLLVASHMVSDLHSSGAKFFYHLGDVVYFNGEASQYYAQFYDPYLEYDAPIFAIPGNHDGDNLTGTTSLAAFVENFCAKGLVTTPEAGDAPRHAMTQPNVYWTLEAPYVTIIGLYTNVPEGGQLDNDQIAWFQAEMANADPQKALIVTMHHPIYSYDTFHSGSVVMGTILNNAISATGRVPDMVLTGHVHNYQRFTRQFTDAAGKQRAIPYIVNGAGGYYHLHSVQAVSGKKVSPGYTVQVDNSDVKLETYADTLYGFLRLEVSQNAIKGTYLTVPKASEPQDTPASVFDTFTLDLQTHTLS